MASVWRRFPAITLRRRGSLAQLMVTLLVYGVSGGLMDVAMNSQAVRVEREYRRPLINSFHAYYSFGGLAGDCGLYHGWLVGVDEVGARPPVQFNVKVSAPAFVGVTV